MPEIQRTASYTASVHRSTSRTTLEALIKSSVQHNDLDQAEQACKQLIVLDPRHTGARYVVAQIENQRGNVDSALAYLRRCVELRPAKRTYRMALAKSLRRIGQADEALAELSTLQDFAPAAIEHADLLEHLGRYTECEAAVNRLAAAGEAGPQLTEVRANLALHQNQPARALELARSALQDENLDARRRTDFLFIASQAQGQLEEFEESVRVCQMANDSLRQPLDRSAFSTGIEQTLKFFSQQQLKAPLAGSLSPRPVFIACLPRSGSTLLERMIACHPNAVAAGEVDYFYRLRETLLADGFSYPSCIEGMSEAQRQSIAHGYLKRVDRVVTPRTECILDKSIENYRELGLIATLFPNARLIHLRRDALDCCVSMFLNPLYMLPTLTCALEDIAFFYNQYQRCMRHWVDEAKLPILDVAYEDLVQSPEKEMRRILSFLDLPWDSACLEHDQSRHLVRTLSYHQVSQTVYTSAVGNSAPYRPYVRKLVDLLEATS